MFVLTAQNMKKAEERAVAGGRSFYELMDAAGTGCADIIAENGRGGEDKKTVVLCGKGRNGGDGLVIARRLWQSGFKNTFVIFTDGVTQEPLCSVMLEELKSYPVDITDMTENEGTALYHISSADVLIDAVFGIGFRGELRGGALKAVKAANNNKNAKKYAVDIPSGLSSSGEYGGQTHFETDETLTMIAFKPVHVLNGSRELCGKTTVLPIGVGSECTAPFAEKYESLTFPEAKNLIKPRRGDSNKGNYGKILTICGSRNMTGCVYLCSRAAVEAGAGLVISSFPAGLYNIAVSRLTEPVFLPLPENANGSISEKSVPLLESRLRDSSAVAIGCGLGVDSDTKALVRFIIESSPCPVVLDADALNCIAKDASVLKKAKSDIIITPHPGEMARLTGRSIAEIQENRTKAAEIFAKEYGVTVVLKGSGTVIANGERTFINTTGNPGMARGGSGDVLTGVIAALIPQTESTFSAAALGAYLHGRTGDLLKEKYGDIAVTPSRIAENLYMAML